MTNLHELRRAYRQTGDVTPLVNAVIERDIAIRWLKGLLDDAGIEIDTREQAINELTRELVGLA